MIEKENYSDFEDTECSIARVKYDALIYIHTKVTLLYTKILMSTHFHKFQPFFRNLNQLRNEITCLKIIEI